MYNEWIFLLEKKKENVSFSRYSDIYVFGESKICDVIKDITAL